MKLDRIVKGGNVVTPAGTFVGDVGISGEKIAALGADLEPGPGTDVIDATGHHVLPGVLDVHVHLELPFCGTVSADDYRTGTRAGARGGVTTVIDFAIPYAGESLGQAADNWLRKAEGKSLIDYTFHICITRWAEHQSQIKEMVDRGFTTFKEFMIYESEGWQSDDRALFGTLERMREYGTMLLVHAESARVLDELIARHHTPELMARYGARLHPMTRPNFVEAEAIQRAVQWCEATGGQLYIVHMSTAEGSDIVRAAQGRGVPVLYTLTPRRQPDILERHMATDRAVSFTGISFENPFLFSSAPPTESESNILRAFEAGWGGVVTKTIGLHPVVNVVGAKAKFMRTSPEDAYVSMKKRPGAALHSSWNWELISDKTLDWWLPRIRRIKEAFPDRVLIASIMAGSGNDKELKNWQRLARDCQDAGADGLELNFSCPHMDRRDMGSNIGKDEGLCSVVTEAVKEVATVPVWCKLTPATAEIEVEAAPASAAAPTPSCPPIPSPPFRSSIPRRWSSRSTWTASSPAVDSAGRRSCRSRWRRWRR